MMRNKVQWEVKKLGEVCEKGTSNISINKIDSAEFDGDYPLYGASGLVKGVNFYHRDEEYIGIVKDGAGVGRVGIYPAKSSLVGTMQYILVGKQVTTKYLYYVLNNMHLAKYASGATIPHIYFKNYGQEPIPVPPLSVQSSIVSELDLLSGVIEKKKQQLAELDNLAHAIFYDMFGDPVNNEKGWEVKKLGEVCSKITDGTHASTKFIDSGIPFIFVSNIVDFEIQYDVQKYIDEQTYTELWKSTPVEVGDIVYTTVGSYGNPAVVRSDKKFMFQRHIALLKPKHEIIDSVFLKWFLISPGGKYQAQTRAIGIAQKTLNLSAIKQFSLILPPLPLQQLFATKISSIENQKGKIKQSLAEAETLFQSRMSYHFD